MHKRNSLKQILALALAVLLLIPCVLAEENLPAENPAEASVPTGNENLSKEKMNLPGQPDETWALLLVSPDCPLPEEYALELTELKNGMQVDSRIYDDLNALLTACWAAGLKPQVCSAYRTAATQTRLYNNKVSRLRTQGYSKKRAQIEAARWVALPDTSEHQTGMALDLVSMDYPNLTHKQANTAEQKWLMKHCWEYGFILRYPADKTEETGIGYEPWHYRYVGRQAAAAMHKSGDCLEEYLLTGRTLP
ncbi:MAG: M15 family metallopeptidase [Oscillibacter sp.]